MGESTLAESSPLRWVPEFVELSKRRFRTQGRLLGAAVLVGIVAGLGAIVFSGMCHFMVRFTLDGIAGYRGEEPHHEAKVRGLAPSDQPLRPWLLILVPAVGGLVSGLIVFNLAPEAEGHGTDAVIRAYHRGQGEIRTRVPLVKMVASAITLGTGGSGGREGPIAQIGAGFGSALAKALRMRPAERRILLAAGMGAGIAAVFRAPLAGSLFAAEVLYRSPEFEQEVLIPTGIASVLSYSTYALVFGWEPLFLARDLSFDNPWQLLPYLVLALAMAMLAMVYTRTFYGLTALFHRLPVRGWWRSSLGALLTGVIGVTLFYALGEDMLALNVLSFGYGILQQGMNEGLRGPSGIGVAALVAVSLGKLLTTSLTIGSGGSGGVFGPSIVIGGCAGGALGLVLQDLLGPELVPYPSSFMIVGMAGFFAAAAKTPFSTLAIVVEMTGDYALLLPTLWVCVISYLMSDEQSIYSEQVESRSRSPAHKGFFVREALQGLQVSQYIDTSRRVPLLTAKDSLAVVLDELDKTELAVLPVVSADQQLVGVVSLEEVHLASQSPHLQSWVVVEDIMRARIAPLLPEMSLDEALEWFVENDCPDLPVVASKTDRRVIAMLHMGDIAKAYLRQLHGRVS